MSSGPRAKEEHATKAEGEVKSRRVSSDELRAQEEHATKAEGEVKSRRVSSDELRAKEEHATMAEGTRSPAACRLLSSRPRRSTRPRRRGR